ncbi:SDR family oxidoreductase [Micromonospora wenchangensis]|uniref:SDR family oxidoreductase n=1 Tax=Micromonospora wenchangensis TaxID=1185415 RepID=UPI0037F18073
MSAAVVTTQVVVVGAGPVGLLLAGELRAGGVDVVVLERLPARSGESRASVLHTRTMELLAERGILDRLGPLSPAGPGHFGGIPLDLRVADRGHPHAGQWHCLQSDLEPVLEVRAAERGAWLLRGHQVTGVVADRDKVVVTASGPQGPIRVSAGYLVGCDGAGSTVRRLLRWPLVGQAATRRLLRADVAGLDLPDRRLRRYDRGVATAARRPDDTTRLMVHPFGWPSGSAGAPAWGEVVRAWRTVTGEEIGHGRPLWLNSFDDASWLAARYRRGRVLLAGDAAHVQMPIGGQALNLGLQDAVELGGRLAARVTGMARDEALDGYHEIRHPVGVRTLNNIRAQTQLLFGGAEVDPLRTVLGGVLRIPAAQRHLARAVSALDVARPAPPPRPGPIAQDRRAEPYPGEDDEPGCLRQEGRTTMHRLNGRTALVTGSSRGIGRATAVRLAREGALVVVHYASNEAGAGATVEQIEQEGGRAFAVRAELGVPGDVHELFLGLEQGLKERTGDTTLDIVINNAGATTTGSPPEEITPEEFDRYVAVNARAPFFIVQRALPLMTRGGRIVNISSGVTRCANPGQVVYGMTKGAIEQLSLHLARHLAPRGITVNTVAPGITDNGGPVFDLPEVVEQMAQLSAFKRVGEAGDVADVVTFLATDEARWVTGAFIDATGGTLLGQ